jgi:hypothetical protein
MNKEQITNDSIAGLIVALTVALATGIWRKVERLKKGTPPLHVRWFFFKQSLPRFFMSKKKWEDRERKKMRDLRESLFGTLEDSQADHTKDESIS